MSKITTTILLGLILSQPVLSATPRTALIIGNAAYQEGPLSAPVRDARALAKVLRKLGFQVIERSNLNLEEMEQAIGKFHKLLSQRSGVGLFYYSGHGIQYENQNYLIPIGANLYGAYALPRKTIAVNEVLEAMNSAGNTVNLVFLDSCRTPPEMVKSWTKGKEIPPGMAKQSEVPGSLIAYAAAPGKPALDGKNGQNSPYVKHMLKWIQVPNLSITDALTQVRRSVMKATRYRQEPQQPQFSSALNELFYFNPSAPDKISCPECPQLLRTCQRHFKANRLTTGRGGTALDCYSDVLKKDRNNGEALRGLEKIEAKYVAWIERALSRKQKNKVLQYMAGLRKVNPESPKLAAFEAQMQTPPPIQPQTVTVQPRQRFSAGQVFRDRLKDGSKGPHMVWIAAGSFQMGSNDGESDEKPVHKVNITQDFGMGRYEVTVGEFRQFVNATGYRTEAEKGDGCYIYKNGWWWSSKDWSKERDANWRNPNFSQNDNHPVVCISWNDAQAYTKWLSKQTGKKYRLPTEAEWEYVARAGTTTKYWWGNTASHEYANYGADSCCSGLAKGKDRWEYTAPVGSFAPNQFGIYDTVGNVWEWTQDIYSSDYYSKRIYSDPTGPSTGSYRVYRGGGWFFTAPYCRAAYRGSLSPGDRFSYLGFRLLRKEP
jgi:formylglycine-generating enzyme required for sulfatase activity